MQKLYKLTLIFVGLIVMNISVQAHWGDISLLNSAKSSKANLISSGKDWAGLNAKQATNFFNYPNPALTETTIAYTLTAKANVTLKVIDLTGKQLAILVKQEQAAGKQEFYWVLAKNNITSGMYILLLQVDNKTYSRKIIVQ
ncbi:T9SS type A sorting domain-containing protein [Pedobacter frigiditerrae]|uniref:T9SS type A sorting domain-containing protein n=1 Tax=Pedobacter frigiditerrae TaxID=2530452 RepID=UPI002931AE91|nr:T9SS type A sorting domain-containing protein [Pedobacter frigiditerrae]